MNWNCHTKNHSLSKGACGGGLEAGTPGHARKFKIIQMQLPKVYGPDLPIPMTDDAEDIRMEIEARYELATEQMRKLHF